jgi:SNF2 family DNA or RNA helicase
LGLAGRIRFDVLLTTYEMMLSEESALSAVEWETMIVDEGHRLYVARSSTLKAYSQAFVVPVLSVLVSLRASYL